MKNYVAICLLSLMVSGCAKTLEPSMERMVDDALNRAGLSRHLLCVGWGTPSLRTAKLKYLFIQDEKNLFIYR